MPSPYVPWPRFDRRAYLLLLDDQQRLLLCGGCCGNWTVPQVRIGGGADFLGGATDFLRERFQVHSPRFGSVYGLRQSRLGENWEFDRTTASRVFIIRVDAEQSERFERDSASHARWGISDLQKRRREISPEGAVLLVTGYFEGWIPDGPVSLG